MMSSFIRQVLGCILCAQKYLKCWRYSGDQDRQNPFPHGGSILNGGTKQQKSKMIQIKGLKNKRQIKTRLWGKECITGYFRLTRKVFPRRGHLRGDLTVQKDLEGELGRRGEGGHQGSELGVSLTDSRNGKKVEVVGAEEQCEEWQEGKSEGRRGRLFTR